MNRKPFNLPPLSWLVVTAAVALLRTRPSHGSGCIFLRDDLSIRCQNASLLDVRESLHVLTTVVQNRPRVIDIDDCGGTSMLPPIFGFLDSSSDRSQSTDIDTVRVRRSGLASLHPASLRPLARTLRHLDLSQNRLRAVPEALRHLQGLEHLDLQGNAIAVLPPGSPLDAMPGLQVLNLAGNLIGQAEDRGAGGDHPKRHGYQLKAIIELSDFSLGRTSLSLESLSLRGNRLASVPRQLSGHQPLPRLRHLDLAENVIGRTDGLSRSLLPRLESLDLQSNQIQAVREGALPQGALRFLDLAGNPFHCDCSAHWLYKWLLTNYTVMNLPVCNSPEVLKDTEFEKVPWSQHCREANSTIAFGRAEKGPRDYDVVKLTTTSHSITVSWRVTPEDSDLYSSSDDRHWAVVYRRATDNPRQMTLVTPQRSDQSHPDTAWSLTISGLQEFTGYVVCVALVQRGKYTIEPGKCRQATTRVREAAEAVRTTLEEVSASPTAVVIKWKLSDAADAGHSMRHEWTIRIRRTGSDNFTDIPVYDITSAGETDGQMYEYGVADLSPRTHYDVCLVDVEHRPISDRLTAEPLDGGRPGRGGPNETCATVQTTSDHLLYATEIAAIALASSIAFIVSAVTLFLCRQKRLLKWKPDRLKKWFAVGCKGRPQVPQLSASRYAAGTMPRLRCEEPAGDGVSDRCIVGTWNTLRMPYKDFPQLDEAEETSARGYKDALTTVTIYKSGYSEC